MSDIVEAALRAACKAFSEARAVYPDGGAETPITDWFDLDPKDAVDFGVLTEPKWHGHSDIGNMQHEAYVAAVIKEPMRAALRTALSEAEQQVQDAKRIATNAEHYGYLHGLEAAAKIAETGAFHGAFQTQGDRRRAEGIASRIRALTPSEPHDAEGRE